MSVVVPFAGAAGEAHGLADALGELTLREGDSILIVDNGATALEVAPSSATC